MKKNSVSFLTKTAMLLAIAIVFQNLRILPFLAPGTPYSTIVIGSLVNLVLFVASITVGISGGIVIALITPIISIIQGHITLPILVPLIFIGNSILVIVFSKLYNLNKYVGVVLAAISKWIFLFLMTSYGLKLLFQMNVPDKIMAMFNFPQLITALLGGIIGLIVLKYLKNRL